MVSDPWGTLLAGAGDEQMIVKTKIDPEKVEQARDTFPGLAGRTDLLNPTTA